MLYEIPDMAGFMDLLSFAQDVSPFAEFAVIAAFMIAFFTFSRSGEILEAATASFFIVFLFSLFFFIMGMLSHEWVIAAAVLLGVCAILLHKR